VLRDLDLIKKHGKTSVGFTITTVDGKISNILEPRAPNPKKRLCALSILKREGVETWVFIGPIMPYFTDSEKYLKEIVEKISRTGINKVYLDKLRINTSVRKNIVRKLSFFSCRLAEMYKTLDSKKIKNLYKTVSYTLTELFQYKDIEVVDESMKF
jgi:DNA repair photolyase